jgi:hypothetical protein
MVEFNFFSQQDHDLNFIFDLYNLYCNKNNFKNLGFSNGAKIMADIEEKFNNKNISLLRTGYVPLGYIISDGLNIDEFYIKKNYKNKLKNLINFHKSQFG